MTRLTQMAEQVAHLLASEAIPLSWRKHPQVGCCLGSAGRAGASAYYKGGSVLYTYESRKLLLGMTRADVEGLTL